MALHAKNQNVNSIEIKVGKKQVYSRILQHGLKASRETYKLPPLRINSLRILKKNS